MQEDIDFLVRLEADMVQFMLLMPLPVTGTYKRLKRKGLLRDELPFEEWHGQKRLPWRHPAFGPGEPERWLDAAFAQDYRENSATFYRLCETAQRGYKTLAAREHRDANRETRMHQLAEMAREYGLATAVLADDPINELERRRVIALEAEQRALFGPLKPGEKLKRIAAHAVAALWRVRVRLFGDGIQPRTIVTSYPARVTGSQPRFGVDKLRQLELRAAEALLVDTRQAALVRHDP
jgi:hypothetical protein